MAEREYKIKTEEEMNSFLDLLSLEETTQQDTNRFADLKKKIESPEERIAHIEREMMRLGPDRLSKKMKKAMADFIIGNSKKDSLEGTVLTPNRMATINKREISQEGLVDKLEGGEDTFYLLVKQDKNTILTPKVTITEEDIERVPGLKILRQEIDKLAEDIEKNRVPEEKVKKMKQVLIEMRKDQYALLNMYRQPIYSKGGSGNGDLSQKTRVDVSFTDVETVKSLLVNYHYLKTEHGYSLDSDIKWIVEDLDRLIEKTFKDKQNLLYILKMKTEGYQNKEIREGLIDIFNIKHTEEYISSLYRNKIPKEIVKVATDEYLDYMYLNHWKGAYKKCTKCGKIKLESNRNFSINKTMSSNYYSICKECRNKKNKK